MNQNSYVDYYEDLQVSSNADLERSELAKNVNGSEMTKVQSDAD